MNRRELLKRGFELGAAGLLLPIVEPIRRYWSLDRTMLPDPMAKYWTDPIDIRYPDPATLTTGWFDASMPPFTKQWVETTIEVDDDRLFIHGSQILVDREPMWVTGINGRELTVLRGPV